MAKQPSPVDIMNLMGKAAQQKASAAGGMPEDEEDPLNSHMPNAKKSPADPAAKRVAAAKEQEKAKGKKPPMSKPKGM